MGGLCLLGHKIIQTYYGIFWPWEWPFIKLKHKKLGKPDTKLHYPSKGEGTPATAQSKERVKGPPHPKPKQDDRQQKLLVPTNQNVPCTRCVPPDTKTQKTTWEKLGTYPPTYAVTQNLCGLKVTKILH